MQSRSFLLALTAILLWSASLTASAAHNYIFRVINVSDGLSDSEVRSISRAPNGLMCIRTSRSLNLYNGAVFSQYYYNYEAVPYNENTGSQQDYFDTQGRMWLKEADKIWLFDFNSNEFIYDIPQLIQGARPEKGIKTLFIDDRGNYWIVDGEKNLSCVDPVSLRETKVAPYSDNGAVRIPVEIVRAGGTYWILYENNVLQCLDPASGSFIYRESGLTQSQRGTGFPFRSAARKMLADGKGNLWVLYSNALYHYDTADHTVRPFPEITLTGSDQLTSMDLDADGNLWLGSSKSGLRIVDTERFTVDQLPYLSLVSGDQITHNTDITALHIDPDDGVWIATLTEGILYYHRSMNKFPLVNNKMLRRESMPDQNIKCLVEDKDETLLIGTVRGLLRYDPAKGSITVPYPELANELCIGLFRDRFDRIWLGTFQNGAFCIDRGKIRHYKYDSMPQVHISYSNSTPNLNNVRAFFEDKRGNLWISVYGGIGRFNAHTGEIKLLSDRFPQIGNMMVVRNIHYLNDSILLAASDNGMFRYDPQKDAVYTDSPIDVPDTRFNCTLNDSRSLLWMATFDGLFIYDPASNVTGRIDVSQGLPNNNVYGIAEDDNGDIWLSTFSNLSRIEVSKTPAGYRYKLINFNPNDGVQNSGFFEHSVLKAGDGRIYFGGTHGFNVVSPPDIVYNTITSTPQFVALRLFNAPVEKGVKYNGRTILEHPVNLTGKIELGYNQNFIALDFAGMNYVNPSQTFFRYKLEGVDQQWVELTSNNGMGRAVYTSLKPGKYNFTVYAANNDKAWGELPARMEITIRPPLWGTTLARIIYVVLVLAAVYGLSLFMLRRGQKKLEREKELETLRQQEELDQMKFRFFTNISHELRTPLTLIIAPLHSIVKKMGGAEVKSQLDMVLRNAEQLLSMVNQLLDFRKLEMKGERLKLSGAYITAFTEEVYSSFRELAAGKMVNFDFVCEMSEGTYIYFDKNKLQKILNNLLSNAFKFTPSGGSVTLSINGPVRTEGRDMAEISIADTGVGISPGDIGHIFDRFYQASGSDAGSSVPGTGIGLHLIKEYVQLHEGSVSVNSREGEGTLFTVLIPTDLRPDDPEPAPESEPTEQAGEAAEDAQAAGQPVPGKKTLLLVEDNEEFRNYVKQELLPLYNIVEAANGKEGEAAAIEQHPDLIVSDVMMPVRDGVEMCRNLKTNIETSHIPVILLTARQSDENKLEGYEAGADAYIAKPFNLDMLLLRIRKLIDQQEKRKEQFSKTIEVNPSSITITSLDEQLIQKALECVERNIGNPDYSVEQLSSDVNMHRMNLYRKLQSVVGQTPSEFIRTIRLKRSAQLLQKSQLPVTEIAEMVGFNTPKYFTKYFKEMFGSTPSHYAAQFKGKGEPDDA